jgi:V8-like Glu-specific endopeptidase
MADFLPSVNTDLWGHSVNVVGYPYNWKFEFAGGQSLPVQSPFPQYRLAYPIESVPGMSGGPVFRTDELSSGMKIRAVNTSTYDNNGNALIIYDNLFKWINQWLAELP